MAQSRASVRHYMILTSDHIQSLAPDTQVFNAGQKLARSTHWQSLGRQANVLWGECKGSAVYQVRAELDSMAFKCSCPSRKQPCKHVIGLLLLGSGERAAEPIPADTPLPDWVSQWLAKREQISAKQTHFEEPETEPLAGGATRKRERAAAQKEKRARERMDRVLQGIDALDLWLADIVRHGLASLESQPAAFWERQAARLVDAEAQGLASYVRRLAPIPGSSPDWPDHLLGELGRLSLLTHAFRRIDRLDPALQQTVRQAVGFRLSTEEVSSFGETVTDEWIMLGQYVEEEDHLQVQRSWLQGLRTNRIALVLQFAAGAQPSFPFVATINDSQEMELQFWPGAYPQRARIDRRLAPARYSEGRRTGHATIEDFLASTAGAVAANPWIDRFLAVLHDVVPIPGEKGNWSVRDSTGAVLPLLGGRLYVKSLANSGGHPMDIYAEWDGHTLRPMAFRVIEDIVPGEAG